MTVDELVGSAAEAVADVHSRASIVGGIRLPVGLTPLAAEQATHDAVEQPTTRGVRPVRGDG